MQHSRSTIERIVLVLLAAPLAIPLSQATAMLAQHAWGASGLWTVTATPFGRTLLFQACVWLAIAAYGILVIHDAHHAPFWTRTHTWFAALFAILTCTAMAGADVRFSIFSDTERTDGLLFLTHVGMYALLLTWMIRDHTRVTRFLHMTMTLGLATIAVLTLDALLQHLPFFASATWRLQGTALLGNANFFAHYLLFTLVCHVHAMLEHRSAAERRRWAIAMVFLGYLALVASSTALLLGTALLLTVGWLTHRRWTYGALLVGGLLALAIVAARHDALAGPYRSLADSAAIRWHIWSSGTTTALANHPVLGYGWGNLDLLWNDATTDVFATAYDIHGQFRYDRMHAVVLEILATAGIAGALIGIIAYGRLLVITVQCWQHTRATAWQFWILALTTAFAYLAGNFDTLMSYAIGSVLLAGWVVHAAKPHHAVPLPRTLPVRRALAGTLAIGAVLVGSMIAIQPLRATVYRMRAELAIDAGPRPAHLTAARASLKRASALPHPYDMLRRDLLDTSVRLAQLPLDDATRDALYRDTRALADTLIAHHPRNSYLYHRAAWMHGHFGDREAEATSLRDAVARAPMNGALRFQLALLEVRRGNRDAARAIFEDFAAEGIAPHATPFYLGLLTLWDGAVVDGRRQVTRAIATYTPSGIEWQMLSAAQHETGASDDAIIAWYQRLAGYAAHAAGVRAERERVEAIRNAHAPP
ncbi:MAG: hypothetical protein Q7S96_02220 [bacterium]|nr:hypothetical protein [bacterium]